MLSESFNLENVEKAIKEVFHGVNQLTKRSLTIKQSGEVEAVTFYDGSRLSFKELYYKGDTDIGFFITKFGKKLRSSAKYTMFQTLKELIEDETKVADYSYWEEKSLPSGLSAIVLDLLITKQSITPEKLGIKQ